MSTFMNTQSFEALRAALVVVAECNANGAYDREEKLIRAALLKAIEDGPTITQSDLDQGAEAFEGLYARISSIIKATPEDAEEYDFRASIDATTLAFYGLPLAQQFGFLGAAAKFLSFLSDAGEPELPMSRSGSEGLLGKNPLLLAGAIQHLFDLDRADAEAKSEQIRKLSYCAASLKSVLAITKAAGQDPNALKLKRGNSDAE